MMIQSRSLYIAMIGGGTVLASIGQACDCDELVSQNKWGMEIAGVYNHALTNIRQHSPAPRIDTWGTDVTGLYRVRGSHFLSCRFSYAYGAEAGFKLHQFTLVPGYRYEWKQNEQWCTFAGAGIGIGVSMLDYPGMQHRAYALSNKDDMANVVYGVEVGANYAITPRSQVGCSLGLNGGTAPFRSAAYSDATEEQLNLSVRVTLQVDF